MLIATLIILVLTTALFVQGRVRSDLVALSSLMALIIVGVLEPAEAFSGFSNSILIMMMGLFVVGGGVFQTGLAKIISSNLLKLAGSSQTGLFILVMLVAAVNGAFVSNTGTVALMLPIVVSMGLQTNVQPSRILMPMAFASSMGGMLTLIGTPPNLAIQEVLLKAGEQPLGFFSFTPIGLIVLGVGIVLLFPLSRRLLRSSDKSTTQWGRVSKNSSQLVQEYQLAQNLFRVRIPEYSAISGKTLLQLEIPSRYNINVLEVRRRSGDQKKFFKAVAQECPGPHTRIHAHDIVYVFGAFDDVCQFVAGERLELMDTTSVESQGTQASAQLRFDSIGIAEVVLMPNSSLINKGIKEAGFRDKYGVNILGIHRKREYIVSNLRLEKIRSGDILLVQGAWHDIARMEGDQAEYVIVGQPYEEAIKLPRTHKAPIAALIMLFLVVSLVTHILSPLVAIVLSAMMMVFTGCLRNAEDAYKAINWESIVRIGSMLPMAVALEKTGASALITSTLVAWLGSYSPYALLAGIYVLTSILTLFMNSTATAVLLAPIALSCAKAIGVSPYPFMFAVSVGASMCFSSPFSTPPNALVKAAGRYTFVDYMRVGAPLQIVLAIIMIIVLPLLFPF